MHIGLRNIRRSAPVVLLAAVSLIGSSVAPASPAPEMKNALDTETVYAVLDASGALKNTVVVDWLHVQGSGNVSLVDPAPAAGKIESLTDGFKPERVGDNVVANVTLDGRGDFFYRAETDAELPLEISAKYVLDGVETPPDQLAGKSGHLRIDIAIHNRLERRQTITFKDADGVERSSEVTFAVPMFCAPQLVLDGRRMFNVVPPAGAQIMVTGSKRTYVMMMMPSPDASTTIEMDAENIELDPTVITALPMLPSSPDLSSSSELADLRDGLSQLQQLSEGHLKVVDGIVTRMDAYDLSGASKAVAGLTQLQAGLGQMASGASDLATLSQGQVDYLDGVIAGIDTGQFDSLAELQAALGQMKAAASQLKTGAESLVALLDAQIGLVEQLQDSNAALARKATQLTDARPGDVALQDLATGLNGQDALIAALLNGGDLGSGYMPGLRETRTQLDGVASGLADLESGLAQLEAQSASLSAVPQAFEELKAALAVLRDGGVVQGQPFPGLNTTASGLKGIADGLAQTSSGLSGSSATFDEFSSLPAS